MRRHIYYTLQSLLHKQGSNAIKIVSLALGLLMSVFLFARIAFELSFDNFYHDSDNLYIVKTGWLKNGVLEGNESRFTIIPIPAAIAGRDLLVTSQTGSGKTAAFMLPSLQRLTIFGFNISTDAACRIHRQLTAGVNGRQDPFTFAITLICLFKIGRAHV